MESAVAKAIQLKYQPVALSWSDEKPAVARPSAFILIAKLNQKNRVRL